MLESRDPTKIEYDHNSGLVRARKEPTKTWKYGKRVKEARWSITEGYALIERGSNCNPK